MNKKPIIPVKTVQLVGQEDNARLQDIRAMLESSFSSNGKFKVLSASSEGPDPLASFNIYFDSDLDFARKDKGKAKEILDLHKTKTRSILDITEDKFTSDDWGQRLTLSALCVNYLTCNSAQMQEVIYMHTGRLAAIVEDSILSHDHSELRDPEVYKPEKLKDLLILWFGTLEDVFSAKAFEQLLKPYDFVQLIEGHQNPRKEKYTFQEADIIFLPPTQTPESEERRYKKMIKAVLKGKYVYAPLFSRKSQINLEERDPHNVFKNIAEDFEKYILRYLNTSEETLKKEILINQKRVLDVAAKQPNIAQLERALVDTELDDYFDNLDATFLESSK